MFLSFLGVLNPLLKNQTAGCVILCFSHVYWHPYASFEGAAITAFPSLPAERPHMSLCTECQDDLSSCELPVYSMDSLIKILPSVCAFSSIKDHCFSICSLSVLLANLGCPCLFEWSHWVRITRPSCFDLEGKDFHVTHPAMDRKRSCTLCGGAVMLLLLGHMINALEVPLDREYCAAKLN